MWITGYTGSRLNEIRTLDPTNPYKIGVNGVFNIQPDFIEYEINGIFYKTYTQEEIPSTFTNSRLNVTSGVKTKTYTSYLSEPTKQNTIFRFQPSDNNFEVKPLIKEEDKLEQVFLPEIEDRIFIERTATNVFEKHMRLMDINNIGQLEIYKNRFFNVKKV
jgi:hypothetical protein